MKSYNGFTPEQRNRAQRWLNQQWKSGAPRPSHCIACGLTNAHGIYDAHAEDYSEPFGTHTGEWPLCYLCHMMVHCRFGSGAVAFRRYVCALQDGYRFPTFTSRNFDTVRRFLNLDPKAWSYGETVRSPRDIPLLTMLARETELEREARIRGYHQAAVA